MAVDDNKALIHRFYDEVWQNGNYGIADDVFAPDYRRHDLRSTQAAPGPEGQKQIARAFRDAFPDLRFDVELSSPRASTSLPAGPPPAPTPVAGAASNRPSAP